MHAVPHLPPGYQEAGIIDIKKDRRLLIFFNLAALVLMVIAGGLFFRAAAWLRPDNGSLSSPEVRISSIPEVAIILTWIIGLTVLYVVIHELIHGLFFWLFTGRKPVFAFHWNYAYAAAPDWFIQRNPFLITTLAPLVLISAAGLLVMAVGPQSWLLATWFVITMNAAGAVGDLFVAIWLLFKPASALVQDRGDALTLFEHK
jgi:hypothetical protein